MDCRALGPRKPKPKRPTSKGPPVQGVGWAARGAANRAMISLPPPHKANIAALCDEIKDEKGKRASRSAMIQALACVATQNLAAWLPALKRWFSER